MKNITELKEERKTIEKKIERAKNTLKNMREAFRADKVQYKLGTENKEFDNYIRKENATRKHLKTLEATLIINKQNIKCMMIKELLPRAIEIINNYEGKKAGEKTKRKLHIELTKLLDGVYLVVNDDNIYIRDGKNFIATTVYNELKIIDGENKFRNISLSEFIIHDTKYIDDIETFIKERQKSIDALKAEYEALREKFNAHNVKYHVEGFEYLSITNHLYFD